MKKNHLIAIIPFIVSIILNLSCFNIDIFPKPIFLYCSVFVFLFGCIFGLVLKLNKQIWFYVWMVFSCLFGLMALDKAFFNENVLTRFIGDSIDRWNDLFFPSPIPFRGLVPLLIFYFAFCFKKEVKVENENKKYAIVIVILYCFYYFIIPYYYANPGLREYFYIKGLNAYQLFNFVFLVNTILFAFFVLFILIKGLGRLRLFYLISFFLLLFISMHSIILINAFNFSDIIFLAKFYTKYIWILSGSFYMFLLLWYKSFRKAYQSKSYGQL